ncbi:hypothetical protein UlMin_009156 [Ulmus minor]
MLSSFHAPPVVAAASPPARLPGTTRRPLGSKSSLSFASSTTVNSSSVGFPVQTLTRLKLPPKPELGLLSLLFVLSTAFGSILCLALLSIPTMNAFRTLAASMDHLSKVVSEEVPGTLSSLRLSGLEIQELTQQLTNLRQKIAATRPTRKKRRNKSSSFGRSGGDSPPKDH